MPKIITVSGKAQNGKDTFANFAKEFYEEKNKKCLIFHYADFLKFICEKYYNWDGKKDEKGRALLQKIGTEVFRKNDPNCWINMAKSFVSGLGETVDYIIIPDARFPNEITFWQFFITEKNLLTVRVERPNYDNGLTEEQKNHQSETALDNWDFDIVIPNNTTLKSYKDKIFDILELIEF